jgi:hypothetical protein
MFDIFCKRMGGNFLMLINDTTISCKSQQCGRDIIIGNSAFQKASTGFLIHSPMEPDGVD